MENILVRSFQLKQNKYINIHKTGLFYESLAEMVYQIMGLKNDITRILILDKKI
jgi:hypothetical protein